MKYENPVVNGADPDVIRVGGDFFMVTSSYNLAPCVPVLHSKNLVEWQLVNHVADGLPFPLASVRCPSIRYHNGKYYCLIGLPDYGIFVSETDAPCKNWSPLRPLVEREGLESPCPVWHNGKCFVVFSINSQIEVFEADEDLTQAGEKFTVIYDGRHNFPLTEAPKIYRYGRYFYIFASAGGTKSGWQICLRAETVYGPYESKVVLMQGITDVNGPNNGSLVSVDGESWAFLHSQYRGAYGCAVHLQPVKYVNDWFLCGEVFDENLAGIPVSGGNYPVDIQTDYKTEPSDEFDSETLSLKWLNPVTRQADWFEMKKGLKLKCRYYENSTLADMPQLFLQNVPYLNFSVKTKCRLNLLNDGDEVGFCVYGIEYAYICVVRRDGQNFLEIRKGNVGGSVDETLCQSQPYDENYVTFQISAKYEDRHKLTYKVTFGGSAFTHKFYAKGGLLSGAQIGIYARANSESKGCGTFKFFRVVCTDNRVSKT